jgi:transposase
MSKTRIIYTEDFRRNALELLFSSGRPLKHVASELGISADALRDWRNRASGKGGAAQAAGRSEAALADPAAEIRRLRRENDYLLRQREILKKAVSILSEDPQSGMR